MEGDITPPLVQPWKEDGAGGYYPPCVGIVSSRPLFMAHGKAAPPHKKGGGTQH